MDGDSLRRIGAHVVKRREQMRLSQADLERASGLSDLTIRRIETGQPIEFRNQTWNKLCDALRWTPESIDLIVDGQEPVVLEPSLPADPLRDLRRRLEELEADVKFLFDLADQDQIERRKLRAVPPAPPEG